MKFPVPEWIPSFHFNSGMARFDANRDHGRRKHAGCDLYAPLRSPIVAIANGRVLDTYYFYCKTYAVEIDHGPGIGVIRYGEIEITPGICRGAVVAEGQQIGKVGHLTGIKAHPMLRFEHYAGTARGPLTVKSALPYMRRADLLDPTPLLFRLKETL